MKNLNEILLDQGEKQQNYITQYCVPIRILGVGSFSTVIEAQNQLSNKSVAIKIIDKKHFDSQQLEVLRKQAQILNQLTHENIVRVTFNKETKNKLYIMMDIINGVTLEQYQKKKLDNQTVLCVTKQILEAIKYLHSKEIIHKEIKPSKNNFEIENIMIDPQSLHVTLIAFGLSAQLGYMNGSGIISNSCETFLYIAPEQIQNKKYNRSVDIWAIGMVVFNLFNQGRNPFFQQIDDKQIYFEKISLMKCNQVSKINEQAMNFLHKTIAYHPEDRLNINQCLEHPWINGKNDKTCTIKIILKAHKIYQKIKHLIQLFLFLQYIKKESRHISPPIRNSTKQPITPIDKMKLTLCIRPKLNSKNTSNSGEKANQFNVESQSVGSNKAIKWTDNIILKSKKERKSCDQLKKIFQVSRIEQHFLLPKLHKSLDRYVKQYQISETECDNQTIYQQYVQNTLLQMKKGEQNKKIVQEDQNSNKIQRTQIQITQGEQRNQRIKSSKPPLQRKNNFQ
ncbi:unnamed protein product [Paramecium sonneborni]|uniref:Protein kinase domain-containing protein n=1 Tax=Paramecium sonneborni TaxID=65129 RepID=A0A8S1QDU5_9CILI|nr:unnamed protein product [Paramecium sonneborni]